MEKHKGVKLFGEILNTLPLFSGDITVDDEISIAKKISIIVIEKEYYSNRELLVNLKSCGLIESEKVYLSRLQNLIDEERKVIQEIQEIK